MTEGPIAVMDDYMGELKLTTRKLRRSAHRSVTELEAGIRKWINELNNDPRPFVWTKTADDPRHPRCLLPEDQPGRLAR
jgi:hypothetical protein